MYVTSGTNYKYIHINNVTLEFIFIDGIIRDNNIYCKLCIKKRMREATLKFYIQRIL